MRRVGIASVLIILLAFVVFRRDGHGVPGPSVVERRYSERIASVQKENNIPRSENLEVTGPLEEVPDKSIEEKNIQDLRLQKAIESVNVGGEVLDRSWSSYRTQIYDVIGVKGLEKNQLDDLIAAYDPIIRDIFEEVRNTPPSAPEYQELRSAHEEVLKAQAEDVRRFLGERRFAYVSAARKEFAKIYKEKTKRSIEVIAW